jgi:transcriptional regulator GlxA family with amidase domain
VHPAVEIAARLIQHETEPLRVDELAHRAGLSACHLSRLFHAQTGVTLIDFRNRQRLERFLHLYGQGRRMNMLEAATHAGFGSYAQFHRVFKRLMGYAPAEYRRNQHAKSPTPSAQGEEFDR